MIFIVDANIIFSAILNPTRHIATILTGLVRSEIVLISPSFLKKELTKHKPRLASLTGVSHDIIDELISIYTKRIIFYAEEIIPLEIWNHADALTRGVDEKDTIYIAFAMFFQCRLWSGDKTLKNHLLAKGFDIVVSTQDLLEVTKA